MGTVAAVMVTGLPSNLLRKIGMDTDIHLHMLGCPEIHIHTHHIIYIYIILHVINYRTIHVYIYIYVTCKNTSKNDQHNCTRYLNDNSMVRSLAKWMHTLDVYILQSLLAFFPSLHLTVYPRTYHG